MFCVVSLQVYVSLWVFLLFRMICFVCKTSFYCLKVFLTLKGQLDRTTAKSPSRVGANQSLHGMDCQNQFEGVCTWAATVPWLHLYFKMQTKICKTSITIVCANFPKGCLSQIFLESAHLYVDLAALFPLHPQNVLTAFFFNVLFTFSFLQPQMFSPNWGEMYNFDAKLL